MRVSLSGPAGPHAFACARVWPGAQPCVFGGEPCRAWLRQPKTQRRRRGWLRRQISMPGRPSYALRARRLPPSAAASLLGSPRSQNDGVWGARLVHSASWMSRWSRGTRSFRRATCIRAKRYVAPLFPASASPLLPALLAADMHRKCVLRESEKGCWALCGAASCQLELGLEDTATSRRKLTRVRSRRRVQGAQGLQPWYERVWQDEHNYLPTTPVDYTKLRCVVCSVAPTRPSPPGAECGGRSRRGRNADSHTPSQ